MGFIRQQEERMALRYLAWQYQRMDRPAPPLSEMEKQAAKIVDDAHAIAHKRGRNVLGIIKELVEDLKKDKKM